MLRTDHKSDEPPVADIPTAEANRRLREQYAEIAALSGGLAHEIKNPLSTIRLNLELLAEDFADSQTPRDRRAVNKIAVVQRECQRLQDLLDSFLGYVKPQRLNLEPSDLNELLDGILEFYRPTAAAAKIDVIRYLNPELPSVQIDRENLKAAILNLILNAEQAMPQGGQLVVRTTPAANGVVLELIDTGIGMDEATKSEIFQAFFSTKPGGTGLGLPATRKIIEAHNGRINVESEPGRGTRFTIWLPIPPRIVAKRDTLDVEAGDVLPGDASLLSPESVVE